MKNRLLLHFILFMIFSSFQLFAQDIQAIEVVNPSCMQTHEEDTISFVVEAKAQEVDSIVITTDVNKTYNMYVSSTRSHYCKTVSLHLGENIVNVSGYKKDVLVKEEKKKIFLTSKVHKEYRYPPKEYASNYFHNDTNEKVCISCHDMSVNEIKGVAFEDVKKSNCYQCHSSITAKKHSHAPSVNWLCTSCHNGEVGVFNKPDIDKTKYTVPDPIGSVCFSCHEKNKEKWSDKRFNHEPADSGRCNKCHNSHSEKNEFYLRKPVWELCTGCHKDKIEGSHIIKTFGRKRHPTHDIKDPSRPGKELSCISCHNPHASNASSLLQSSSVFGLCGRCHKK